MMASDTSSEGAKLPLHPRKAQQVFFVRGVVLLKNFATWSTLQNSETD